MSARKYTVEIKEVLPPMYIVPSDEDCKPIEKKVRVPTGAPSSKAGQAVAIQIPQPDQVIYTRKFSGPLGELLLVIEEAVA